jgi:hypothetical protein
LRNCCEQICTFDEHHEMKQAEYLERKEKHESKRRAETGGNGSSTSNNNGDTAGAEDTMEVVEAPAAAPERPVVHGLLVRIKGEYCASSHTCVQHAKRSIASSSTVSRSMCKQLSHAVSCSAHWHSF